ncbi:MAG: trypsin-like peptidase domain-containing protein [Candidatus Obscuribacterales bacterium]|nr:trypsin-like peptidase domain-containing protein [Candidatus Obscuribacterales bacterium]
MNTQSIHRDSAEGTYPNKKFSTGSAIAGLVAGVLIVAGVWAGYQFGVSQNAASSGPSTKTAPMPVVGKLPIGGENIIADIAAAATPAVVNIDTRTSVTINDNHPFNQFGLDDLFEQRQPKKYESHGSGSGVIIRSDGYILTNNHVVQKADEIKVTLADKRTFMGKVVGKDKYTDLALVKIDASNLKAAKLGESKELRPGDWAIAIGSPLGLSQTVTLGIVSALGRSISNLNAVELVQTDAAINPGNSGGPLLNIRGEVIGINTAIRGDGQNIGFAIPIDIARQVADQLVETGSIKHPYLGIAMQDMDPKLARYMGLASGTKGVVVVKVESDSPADSAGLVSGDIIQRMDGKAVSSSKEIQAMVRGRKPGEVMNVVVLRGQAVVPVEVKVGNFDDVRDSTSSRQE